MGNKNIAFDNMALDSINKGVQTVANTVGITLGPKGRNVILQKEYGPPLITNDGVTIAREIDLKDPALNIGAQLIKEVASKTNDIAGDGTTTATVLAGEMVKLGLVNAAAGANGILLRQGIELATNVAVEELKKLARPVDNHDSIKHVASISANNEMIGNFIADAVDKVGYSGVITTENSQTTNCSLKFVEGMQLRVGYLSPYMVSDVEKMEAVMENTYILLYDGRIDSIKDIMPILEKVVTKHKPIVIMADDYDNDTLSMLILNKMQNIINAVAVKSPGYGEQRKAILEDIAILTGGTVIKPEIGSTLEKAELSSLGIAKKITISKDTTIIVDGLGKAEDIENRKNFIASEMARETEVYDRELLNERLAKLGGGVAIIQVGSATEMAQKELKLRIEDSLNATKAAIEEGIVAGGGTALIQCIPIIDELITKLDGDIKTGAMIVRNALLKPLHLMASNSNISGDVAIKYVLNQNDGTGLNGMTGEYVNMIDAGIIDPVKVTRTALENAASMAATILTTGAVITKAETEKTDNTFKL